MNSLKDQILSAEDITDAEVEIPEWNTTVKLRPFSGAERDEWESQYTAAAKTAKGATANIRARCAVRIIVDENGDRVFTDDDAEALGKKNAKALDRIFDAFMRINKLSKEEVEEAEKNS